MISLNEIKTETGELKILFLEDNMHDMELMMRELKSSGVEFSSQRSENKNDFSEELTRFQPDIILGDYSLPSFNGLHAFRLIKEKQLNIPFILVTGVLTEQMALECLNEGIDDFILKSSLKRLPSAVLNSIQKKKMEAEKEKVAKELEKSKAELQSLLNQIQMSREDERKSIAREIHDELGQVLTAMKIDVSMLRKKVIAGEKIDRDFINVELSTILSLIDSTIETVKRIATELRPEMLDHLGLVEAIKLHVSEFEKKTGVKCIISDIQGHLDLKPEVSITLYRIVQEALTNIARHSEATRVEILIGFDFDKIILEIKDNGIGISDEKASNIKSLGLIGMRERVMMLNGSIKIKGVSGKGTTVSVELYL